MFQAQRTALRWLVLVLCTICVHGQTFRFSTMSWTSCYAVVGTNQDGFFDPLFPSVCADRKNPFRIAVTVNAAYAINGNSQTSMLQRASDDIRNYKAGTSTTLNVFRKQDDHTVERRIGYRTGLGDKSYNPVVVDCPVACAFGTDTSFYQFQIDRLSRDESMVYARFTFEILLPSFGDYTGFFEGCCRPPAVPANPSLDLNNALGLFTNNNFDLPFHLRLDIQVGPPATHAYSSLRFGMPDMVVLRKGGLSGSRPECDSVCGATCNLHFKVQAFHEDDTYRGSLSFRLATPLEMGGYKCVEHLSPTGAVLTDATAADTRLDNFNARCISSFRTPTAPARVIVSPGGEVTFPVEAAGVWQLTIMAICGGCFGGSNGAVPLDLLVRVQDSASDPNPPIATFNGTVIPRLAPATTRLAPISVVCGRPGFTTAQGRALDTVRVGYYDPDDGLSAKCVSSPNAVASIFPTNDFPPGLALSPIVQVGAYSYLDIIWRPRCEDVSQVGLFMLCFAALDSASTAGFRPLVSTPSPLLPGETASAAPSCVFLRSLPPLPNPAPVFRAVPPPLTTPPACSRECCSCCGQVQCGCEAAGVVACCPKIFARAGGVKLLDFQATGEDPLVQLSVDFSFPEGGPAGGLPSGVSMPAVRPAKFGCWAAAQPYAACASAPAVISDVSTQLRWDLTNMSDYFCAVSGGACAGPNAPCTPAAGDVCALRQQAQKTVAPFKLCVRGVQLVPAGVDLARFEAVYGYPLANDTCASCFVISVLSPPFFISQGAVAAGTPNDRSEFYLAVGEPLSINLLGGSINIGMPVTTVLLSDPGAPNGAELTDVTTVAAPGVAQDTGYLRRFRFTPAVEQRGASYRICFQVVDASKEASAVRCFRIFVLEAVVAWTITPCPAALTPATPARLLSPGGPPQSPDCMPCVLAAPSGGGGACPAAPAEPADVSVGCLYALTLAAAAPRYALEVRLRARPACDACNGTVAGAAVAPCGAGGGGGACCGNGACDGYESGDSCPEDCPAEHSSLVNRGMSGPARAQTQTALFQWRPGPSAAGRHVLTCFEAAVPALATGPAGAPAPAAAAVRCVVFRVRRCRYCAPRGATLVSVARHRLGLGWRGLYNVNPGLRDPARLLEQADIAIGPTYVVQEYDTLLSVAAMARTTVRSILEHNRDLASDGRGLVIGQELCLLLCSPPPAAAAAAAAATGAVATGAAAAAT